MARFGRDRPDTPEPAAAAGDAVAVGDAVGGVNEPAGGPSNAELFEAPGVISRRRRSWRRRWRRIHLIVGLSSGVLIALVFATGSALIAAFTVDRWVNPDVHQRASPVTSQVPLEEVVQAGRRAAPEAWGEPIRLSIPGKATYGSQNTYELHFMEPGGCLPNCDASGVGSTYDTRLHYQYIDPGTGQVLSTRSAPTGHLSVSMFELHAHLFSGHTGLWIVGASGVVMVVSAITGLVLWWPLGRHGVGFQIRRRSANARFTYDLHNAVGFYVSLGLLVLAVTGLVRTATTLPPFDAAVDRIVGSPVDVRPAPAMPPPGARRIPVDRAVQIAENAVPDGQLGTVRLPALTDDPGYTGQRPAGVYQVILLLPDSYGVSNVAVVHLEPWTGRVLGIDDTRDDSLPQQIVHQWAGDIHDGSAGGPVGRVVAFLLGLLPAGLLLTGWMMWRTRRRSGRRQRGEAGRRLRPESRPDS
jgi:uncharacterized iron-regulated membrane protein